MRIKKTERNIKPNRFNVTCIFTPEGNLTEAMGQDLIKQFKSIFDPDCYELRGATRSYNIFIVRPKLFFRLYTRI